MIMTLYTVKRCSVVVGTGTDESYDNNDIIRTRRATPSSRLATTKSTTTKKASSGISMMSFSCLIISLLLLQPALFMKSGYSSVSLPILFVEGRKSSPPSHYHRRPTSGSGSSSSSSKRRDLPSRTSPRSGSSSRGGRRPPPVYDGYDYDEMEYNDEGEEEEDDFAGDEEEEEDASFENEDERNDDNDAGYEEEEEEEEEYVRPKRPIPSSKRRAAGSGGAITAAKKKKKKGTSHRYEFDNDYDVDDMEEELLQDERFPPRRSKGAVDTGRPPRRSTTGPSSRRESVSGRRPYPPSSTTTTSTRRPRGSSGVEGPSSRSSSSSSRPPPPSSRGRRSSATAARQPRSRVSSTSRGSRRPPPPPRPSTPQSGRVGGAVVPYAARASSAFTRGLSALRENMPDASTVRESAASAFSATKQTTFTFSRGLYRDMKGLTSSELEQVMLKATRPDDTPVKGKHVERLVGVTYQISARYDIYDAVLRKLWKKMVEPDWRTKMKSIYILHRFSCDGSPDHQAALKARLRELRRTKDPKKKVKYFNSKTLLAGEANPENSKYRAFLARYAHYVLLRAQCFGGMFTEIAPEEDEEEDEIKQRSPSSSSRGKKPSPNSGTTTTHTRKKKSITSTNLRPEHLEASRLLLKAGCACTLRNGEECENTALAVERVASDMIGLTTAIAIALNRALLVMKEQYDTRKQRRQLLDTAATDDKVDSEIIQKWCEFYINELLPQTKNMVHDVMTKLDAYGLYLPSRMGATVSQNLLDFGLKGPSQQDEEEELDDDEEEEEEEEDLYDEEDKDGEKEKKVGETSKGRKIDDDDGGRMTQQQVEEDEKEEEREERKGSSSSSAAETIKTTARRSVGPLSSPASSTSSTSSRRVDDDDEERDDEYEDEYDYEEEYYDEDED